jgi:hypothetical protein
VNRLWRWLGRHYMAALIVSVALVVAIVAALPRLADWRTSRSPCEGALSGDLVDDALSQDEEDEEVNRQRGRYACELSANWDLLLSTEATTMTDEVNAALMEAFHGAWPGVTQTLSSALPAGLPGMVQTDPEDPRAPTTIRLVQDCTGLDGDRRMLVTLEVYDLRDYDAAVQLAVEATNAASDELGCGAGPLPLPATDAPEPSLHELTADSDSPCAAFTPDELPAPLSDQWVTGEAITEGFPVDRCTLGDGDMVRLVLTAWYGIPSHTVRDRVIDLIGDNATAPGGGWQPGRGPGWIYATARCDGEPTLFTAHLDPPDSQDQDLTAAHRAQALARFATGLAERRDCANLRLPGVD